MKRTIFEKGIQYFLHGDYYLPDLKLEQEARPIGRWGRIYRDYLKEYRPVVFNQLVLSGTLWTFLADINELAQQQMEVLIKQMMTSVGVTEKLKETNPMEWVQRMNIIWSSAYEVVLNKVIFS